MTGAIIVDTYSDQNAVQIHLLAALHAGAAEDVREATRVVHAQDVDIILAAESLNESEVNLKRHILHIIVVCGQDAQHHVIRVPNRRVEILVSLSAPVAMTLKASNTGSL